VTSANRFSYVVVPAVGARGWQFDVRDWTGFERTGRRWTKRGAKRAARRVIDAQRALDGGGLDGRH